SWLSAFARQLAIGASRETAYPGQPSLDAPTRSGGDADGPTLLERTPGTEPGSDRRAIANDLSTRIARAVEELPEDQREVFLMRQIQGMAFKEIAEVVGVPENTVKSRMRYALERLQRALEEYRDYVGDLK